jgi:hypothetical protein
MDCLGRRGKRLVLHDHQNQSAGRHSMGICKALGDIMHIKK